MVAESTDIPAKGFHFTYLKYLVDEGFVDLTIDEKPPREIELKKPLGKGKRFLWVSFNKEQINLNTLSSIEARNLLGLPATKKDYLYYFELSLEKDLWIPSVFDAFGRPPFRPAGKNFKWGITRNLVDDSEGVPELLILPLQNLSECNTGYLVEPKINQLPPKGYVSKRLKDFANHPETKKWVP